VIARPSKPRGPASACAAIALLLVAACTPPPPEPPTIIVAIPTGTTPPAAPPEERPSRVCPPEMVPLAGGEMRLEEKSIQIADFCLDQREVTADEYKLCVDRGECDAEGLQCDDTWNYMKEGREDHPINCVSWQQSTAYCGRLGKRLPSFEEWEWAAQGRTAARRFSWGDGEPDPDQLCWAKASKDPGTCPVGRYPRSRTPEGVDDMFGNVWEWLAPMERNGVPNVARGGSWHNDGIDTLEGENAGNFVLGFIRNDVVGFRCASTR
jgi:sulfatase modifying factor 1